MPQLPEGLAGLRSVKLGVRWISFHDISIVRITTQSAQFFKSSQQIHPEGFEPSISHLSDVRSTTKLRVCLSHMEGNCTEPNLHGCRSRAQRLRPVHTVLHQRDGSARQSPIRSLGDDKHRYAPYVCGVCPLMRNWVINHRNYSTTCIPQCQVIFTDLLKFITVVIVS